MVAGGFNSRDSFLNTVEYLDIGPNTEISNLKSLKWRNLPEMKHSQSNSLVLVDSKYEKQTYET